MKAPLYLVAMLPACCFVSSCKLTKQQVDYTWFKDTFTRPQNDTVSVESGQGLPEHARPQLETNSATTPLPWQQQAPQQATSHPTPPQTASPEPQRPSHPTAAATSYTVQKGDTLSGIARRHQTSLSALCAANGLNAAQSAIIKPGQTLRIPAAPAASPNAHSRHTAAIAPPLPATGATSYTVRQGDTLSGIAARHRTTVAKLLKANNITPSKAGAIRVGQKLAIPRN